MTYTQAKNKILAAKQMTARNLPHHKVHLERGYVYASPSELCKNKMIGPNRFIGDFPSSRWFIKQIWAINSESKIVMI